MSLWKINDDATELFMTTFYIMLVKEESKYESFEKAVDAVREKMENPTYWVAFTILN